MEENKEEKEIEIVTTKEDTLQGADEVVTSSDVEQVVPSDTPAIGQSIEPLLSQDEQKETQETQEAGEVVGGQEEEDELTGIEEATEQEIVQKVTKKESRRRKKRRIDKSGQDKVKEAPEWIEKVVQIRRVTKVVKGGKKLSFRAVIIVGNAKGQVGVGVGKALEVISAIQKGIVDAKKNLITIELISATIPHQVMGRASASMVLLKPAREGTGIIAGGAARTVLELGGVGDILSKSLGSRSPLNVARATIDGLKQLRKFTDIAKLRGLTLKEMLTA